MRSDGDPILDNGACVTDIAYFGGYLYATVGNPIPCAKDANQNCIIGAAVTITQCNPSITPGLYRVKLESLPTAVNVLRLVPGPSAGGQTPFQDPRAVAVGGPDPASPFIVVADWAVPDKTNKCSAGLWRWQGAAPGLGGQTAVWDYIARQKNIATLSWLDSKNAILAFVVCNASRQNFGNSFGAGEVWPNPMAAAVGATLSGVVSHLTQGYRKNDHGALG